MFTAYYHSYDFTSITLAMCQINDTKKLRHISDKTLSGFLTTLIFPLIVAVIYRFITYNLGLFNVSLSSGTVTSQVASSGNPLMVILNAVPNNIENVLITNSRVLSVVFLGVVTGIYINKLGDQILVVKKHLQI